MSFSIMILHWTTLLAVLWIILFSFTENIRASPCAEVNSASTVVPFGSAVIASCYIKEDCPLTKTQDFLIKWKKNSHFMPSAKGSQKNVYDILISNFTDIQAMLECFVCLSDICHVVGGMEIRAMFPPPTPQNLTCLLNLNEPATLECMWDPGKRIPDISTNYTLFTEIRDTSTIQRFAYFAQPEENFYRVPRGGFTFFHEVQVYVVAVNAFGQATSNHLVLDPMETAKLDAPVIQGVGTQTFGCLEYKWRLSHAQKWIKKSINISVKCEPMANKNFRKPQFFQRRPDQKVKVCGLLHGMSYKLQMRVRYQSTSPWSEWSNATVATTPMKAPSGQLITWLKLQSPESKNQTAHLLWKSSLQFHANSMNLSYTVTLMEKFKRKTVCNTNQQYCSFQIHAKIRKVLLTAMNEAGKSNPTTVLVYRQRGMDPVPFLEIFSHNENTLEAKWKSPDTSGISAYVLEWKAKCGANANHVSFEIVDRNQTTFNVSGLKPYMPYEISVYPKYGDGIGRPNSIVAYTLEKAPSISPQLEIGMITASSVELSWLEIPLQQRNGIITGYNIFYTDEKNNTRVIHTEDRRVVLKELYPFTIYEIFLMTNTRGGSVYGFPVTVKTTSIDAFDIFLIVIPACVGLTLFFFGVFTCFSKQKWMKKYVWPEIPDPANSNIKKWTTADSLECMPPFKELKDPVLVYLSHVSLLSLAEKELSKKGDESFKSNNWGDNGKSADTGHDDSPHDAKTFDSEQQSESVPYATVVFARPYRCHSIAPPVYLRSESTQPLLGDEEPTSPRPYEKMTTQVNLPEVDHFSTFHKNLGAGEEKASLWVDFPMLRSLEINSKN